jgi:hypothetical protein
MTCVLSEIRLTRRAKQEHDGIMADWELSWRGASSVSTVIPREGGESSIPEMRHTTAAAYWIARLLFRPET